MTDEKIIDLGTKKPFELVTGGEGQSAAQIIALLQRFLKYASEKNYQAVAIMMVDAEHRSITGFHVEAGMSTALAGAVSYELFRLNKHMDSE